MITYVSKENNLGPGDKIRYIWVLKVRFLFCKAQLSALTSYIYIKCYHFMRSVFRNALVNGYIS